ncbi:MAG: AAA family ATPase [Candidatus Altiarchaeales archaeon]|nr:AAA family ATPase [Candidatus Altiarchaeales archaeon]
MTVEEEDRAIVSLLSSSLTEALDYLRVPYYEELFPARQSVAIWIRDFVDSNQELPKKKQLRRHFPDVDTIQRPEPLDYTFGELRTSLVKETAVNANNKGAEAYSKGDLDGFLKISEEMIDRVTEYRSPVSEAAYTVEAHVEQTAAKVDESPEDLEPIESGIVPYDEIYGGFDRGCLHVLSSLINLGKTYVACHVSEYARSKGHSVIFYSMEMPKSKIADRILALRYRLNADEYVRKQQTDKSKDKGESYVDFLKAQVQIIRERISKEPAEEGSLVIMESGEQAITPRIISRDIQKYNAELVIIDAAQDLRDNRMARERTPGLYRAIAELNGTALRHNAAVLMTVQMDPDVERKGLKKGNLTRVQWGQVFAQKADVVMTMLGDRTSPQREITLDKTRDGSVGRKIELHMHFPFVELEFLSVEAMNISFDDEDVAEDVNAMEEAIMFAEKEVENRSGKSRPPPKTGGDDLDEEENEEEENEEEEKPRYKRRFPSRKFRRRRH